MRTRISVLLLAAIIPLAACVAPTGPVEVTRFTAPDASLRQGGIAVEPANGVDGAGLEFRSYAAAVARQLVLHGYEERPVGAAEQVAVVHIERRSYRPDRAGGPVSVGVGGGTGGYGSGVGVGIGFDLSGPPKEQIDTTLFVTIRQRAGGKVLWEGRASFTTRAGSPLADTPLGAAKLAEALFQDFPGRSGETILVK